MVERRHDQKPDESGRGKEHDDLLFGLLLRCRAAGQAALEQRRIVLFEIDHDQERRPDEDRQKHPTLPIANGSRCDEKHEPHHHREEEKSEPRFDIQTIHANCSWPIPMHACRPPRLTNSSLIWIVSALPTRRCGIRRYSRSRKRGRSVTATTSAADLPKTCSCATRKGLCSWSSRRKMRRSNSNRCTGCWAAAGRCPRVWARR